MPLILLLPVVLGTVAAGSLRYDQTQSGDTNIHLQIKNVEVLALLEEASAGEYEYDYSEYTEKPPKPGAASNVSSSTSLPIEDSNATVSSSAPANATEAQAAPSTEAQEPLLASTPAPTEEATTKKARRCGAGFYRDTLGRCRRIRRPHLQMMMNLARAKTTERATAT